MQTNASGINDKGVLTLGKSNGPKGNVSQTFLGYQLQVIPINSGFNMILSGVVYTCSDGAKLSRSDAI